MAMVFNSDVFKKFEHKDKKNILNYIELVYSGESDLRNIQDLEERKRKACDKSGLRYDDPEVQKILHMKNILVNPMIFEYCERQNSNETFLLLADQHFFWEQMQILMEPLKKITEEGQTETLDDEAMMKRTNLKNTISKNCGELLERINTRRTLVYHGTDEVKAVEVEMVRTPESRLKKNVA